MTEERIVSPVHVYKELMNAGVSWQLSPETVYPLLVPMAYLESKDMLYLRPDALITDLEREVKITDRQRDALTSAFDRAAVYSFLEYVRQKEEKLSRLREGALLTYEWRKNMSASKVEQAEGRLYVLDSEGERVGLFHRAIKGDPAEAFQKDSVEELKEQGKVGIYVLSFG